ncbi:MAG TPA: hypothetical protein VGI81_14435 [Tepidisphaeraceae bacterium]|jgi:hypothetical protein
MPTTPFESLLDHVDPGFVCWLASGRSREEGYLKRVEHLANPPADSNLLDRIPAVPGADVARALYSRYNGALLYTARDSMGGLRAPGLGVEIVPIDEWPERTEAMVHSWAFEEYDDAQMPYGRHDFVAFAYPRGASNHVHWVIAGPAAGSIYFWPWTMRPELHTPPLARNFGAFITLLCTEPVHLLNDVFGCHWRAEEGLKEWIPSRYLPDCRNVQIKR